MAGIGYDAKVVNNINPKLKKVFGKLIFALEGLKQFFKLKEFNITITSNNQTHHANWVLITNAKYYAGPHSITKRTNIFNEDLVCYLFQDLTKLSFLYNLFLIIFLEICQNLKKLKQFIHLLLILVRNIQHLFNVTGSPLVIFLPPSKVIKSS